MHIETAKNFNLQIGFLQRYFQNIAGERFKIWLYLVDFRLNSQERAMVHIHTEFAPKET
jgi:hypothetical protein